MSLTSPPEVIILLFNHYTAKDLGNLTNFLARFGALVRDNAELDKITTTQWCVVGELHEVVDGLVDGLDAISVVPGKFRVVWNLNQFVNNTVDDSQGIHLKGDAFFLPAGDERVLFIKVVIERRSVVSTIRLSPQVECPVLDCAIQSRELSQEGL